MDQLISLPTGYGKSMCYALPPLLLEKHTGQHKSVIIISPLKSLISSQVQEFRARGVCVAKIVEEKEMEDIDKDAIMTGNASLIFATPEAMLHGKWKERMTELAESGKLCLQAYDEAHCISEWGLDFRPSYRKVGSLVAVLQCPVMALTGMITTVIKKDITKILMLSESSTLVYRSPDQ